LNRFTQRGIERLISFIDGVLHPVTSLFISEFAFFREVFLFNHRISRLSGFLFHKTIHVVIFFLFGLACLNISNRFSDEVTYNNYRFFNLSFFLDLNRGVHNNFRSLYENISPNFMSESVVLASHHTEVALVAAFFLRSSEFNFPSVFLISTDRSA